MHQRSTWPAFLMLAAAQLGCGGSEPQGEPAGADSVTSSGAGEEASRAAITFPLLDEVRSLDLIEPYRVFPEALKRLDGKEVSIVGFMAPYDSLDSMRRCMIVPSYVGCTFCSPPELNQVVYVRQGSDDAPDGSYPYIDSVVNVRGTLRLSYPESSHEGHLEGFIYSFENAVVEGGAGEARVRAAGHSTAPHQAGAQEVSAMTSEELVDQVTDILGLEPLRPIEFKLVDADEFRALVEARAEGTFSGSGLALRAKAFQLLGLLPEGADWIDSVTEYQLSRRVSLADGEHDRVYVLNSVPNQDPYARLDVVGEIALTLAHQHGLRVSMPAALPGGGEPGGADSDDGRRAREALTQGLRAMVSRRYATAHGISPSAPAPIEIVRPGGSPDFVLWQAMTGFCGFFFVRAIIGDASPLTDLKATFAAPPTTTMEVFRPRWYQDSAFWEPDSVPPTFADDFMGAAPAMTDVLGVGGLFPFLRRWYDLDETLSYVAGWTGDRWAIWELPDGSTKMLIELRWRTEEDAVYFRDSLWGDSNWTLLPHEPGSTRVRMTAVD